MGEDDEDGYEAETARFLAAAPPRPSGAGAHPPSVTRSLFLATVLVGAALGGGCTYLLASQEAADAARLRSSVASLVQGLDTERQEHTSLLRPAPIVAFENDFYKAV